MQSANTLPFFQQSLPKISTPETPSNNKNVNETIAEDDAGLPVNQNKTDVHEGNSMTSLTNQSSVQNKFQYKNNPPSSSLRTDQNVTKNTSSVTQKLPQALLESFQPLPSTTSSEKSTHNRPAPKRFGADKTAFLNDQQTTQSSGTSQQNTPAVLSNDIREKGKEHLEKFLLGMNKPKIPQKDEKIDPSQANSTEHPSSTEVLAQEVISPAVSDSFVLKNVKHIEAHSCRHSKHRHAYGESHEIRGLFSWDSASRCQTFTFTNQDDYVSALDNVVKNYNASADLMQAQTGRKALKMVKAYFAIDLYSTHNPSYHSLHNDSNSPQTLLIIDSLDDLKKWKADPCLVYELEPRPSQKW